MIFLSHNTKDKILVEPIALNLRKIFGQDNVFYDSWSIQPGDGIIDKIDSGLQYCKFFFLFISKNSLQSNMVKMEWQNALFKSAYEAVKIIPIRIDQSAIPAILRQYKYLDLFQNGPAIVLRQIVDIVSGKNAFVEEHNILPENLVAIISGDTNLIKLTIKALYYMEPISSFAIFSDSGQSDLEISLQESGMIQHSFSPNVTLDNGEEGSFRAFKIPTPITPGFPLEILLKVKEGTKVKIKAIMHEVSKNQWRTIPLALFAIDDLWESVSKTIENLFTRLGGEE